MSKLNFGVKWLNVQMLRIMINPLSLGDIVHISGELSGGTSMPSGAAQGSAISPLLYPLFVNDLPDALEALTTLFGGHKPSQISYYRNGNDRRNGACRSIMLSAITSQLGEKNPWECLFS